MRWDFIIVSAPAFDEDTRFGAIKKPFHGRALIAILTVKALIGAVLPMPTRFHQNGRQMLISVPSQQLCTDGLEVISAAKIGRRSSQTD